MSRITSFYRSSLGKKAVMAATGIILFGFVFVHMVGNLKMYQGPEVYNAYAEGLREIGYPIVPHNGLLWIARLTLVAAVLLHMLSAWQVTRQSWAARPSRYSKKTILQADYAVRTIRWGGVIIAFFVAYHIMHLTVGLAWAHPDFRAGEVYHNVVTAFGNPWVALFYIAANLFLGLHLFHGVWAFFQTLGWNHPRYNSWRRNFASLFAFVITAGNVSFPIAVLTGIVS